LTTQQQQRMGLGIYMYFAVNNNTRKIHFILYNALTLNFNPRSVDMLTDAIPIIPPADMIVNVHPWTSSSNTLIQAADFFLWFDNDGASDQQSVFARSYLSTAPPSPVFAHWIRFEIIAEA
jgi:hypothetical protein